MALAARDRWAAMSFCFCSVNHRIEAALYDPDHRRLDELTAYLRTLGAKVVHAATLAELERLPGDSVDLVVFGGPELSSAYAAVKRLAPHALAVELVVNDSVADVEAALERGADDVLVLGQLGRCAALVKRAHRQRRRSAAPESLLANVSDHVIQVDATGTATYMNRGGSILDVSRGVGARASEHFPPSHRQLVERLLDEARAAREIRTFDFRVDAHTYRVRIVPSDGGALTLIASDVTEVSDALTLLGESEARAGAILSAMPDLVFRMTEDGTFLEAHAPQSSELLYPPAEVVGKKVSELLPPNVTAVVEPAILRVLRDRAPELLTYELDVRGAMFAYEARIIPIGVRQVLAIVRNMTEYNLHQNRLAVAERLVSLGTMAAGVAHEINGPLTFVVLGLEWLEQRIQAIEAPSTREPPGEAPMTERLRDVLDGVARIQRIVRDLKGFTRNDEPDGALRDVSSAIDGALSLAAAELRYRTRVEKSYGVVPPVRGSHARLGQVFTNLIVNAAHSLPEDTTADNVVRLRTFVALDGRVAIEVSDTGRGIHKEHIPRLFEPFFTTKPPGQGTGLGLWVCHEIVKELGGEIEVESEVGVGSTFRVLLPAATIVAPEVPVVPPSAPPRARILVIDDEPNLAKTLAILLDDHVVEVCLGGESALERLEKDRDFDLVLCDLMMPIVTGMDVYATAKAKWPAVAERFAFMTGGAFTPRARAFLDSCNLPRLDKPFRAEGVKALLRKKAFARSGSTDVDKP